MITLCDTNGGSLPSDILAITARARQVVTVRLGIHTHDDIGLGVANALAALEAGVTHIQGTINGYGERTGNCNLTSVMPILQFKYGRSSVPAESLAQLKELSQFLDETANLRPNPRLPWVGAAAFSHKGGTHVNAVQKVIRSYEHIDPALIGNARHVLISDLAGRSNIVMKARELGFEVTNDTPEPAGHAGPRQRRSSTRATNSSRRTARSHCSSAVRSLVKSVRSWSTRITCRCATTARRRSARPPSRSGSARRPPTRWPTATARSTRSTPRCVPRS